MKAAFLRAVSVGVHEELTEQRRLAIQIGTLDAYWSFICAFVFLLVAYIHHSPTLVLVHALSMLSYIVGIWLLVRRNYDLARFLIHCSCIVEVYLTVDSYPVTSGVDLFYFPTMMIPFLTFSVDEQWKGNIQIAFACFAYVLQQYLGIGYFLPVIERTPVDKMVSIILVVSYVPLILGTLRWQVKAVRDKLMSQHEESLRNSTVKAIGEMSIEIAHEINNPLQSLSLQLAVLKEKNVELKEEISRMDQTIQKIGKLVQGIKDLGSKSEIKDEFVFSKILEDLLIFSADRIKDQNIKVYIEGDTELKVYAHSKQIFQVINKLFTDAMNGLKNENQKWIQIDVSRKNHFIHVSMMTNVSTIITDLDVSKSVIEKSNGSLFMDPLSSHSRIILLLPLVNE